MWFEDREPCVPSISEHSIKGAPDRFPRLQQAVEVIGWRQWITGGCRGRCERQHGRVQAFSERLTDAAFEVLELRVLLVGVVGIEPVRVAPSCGFAVLVLEHGLDTVLVLDVHPVPTDRPVPGGRAISVEMRVVTHLLAKGHSVAFCEGLFS